MKVLEKFESAIDALDQSRIEKARDTLKEGMDLVLHQIKLVRIADKSEFGWETVNKYEADELASDSEGDKSIYRLERRQKRRRPSLIATAVPATANSGRYPIPSFTSNRASVLSALGACYTCGKFGHLQAKCPQRASFEISKPQL